MHGQTVNKIGVPGTLKGHETTLFIPGVTDIKESVVKCGTCSINGLIHGKPCAALVAFAIYIKISTLFFTVVHVLFSYHCLFV